MRVIINTENVSRVTRLLFDHLNRNNVYCQKVFTLYTFDFMLDKKYFKRTLQYVAFPINYHK